MDQVFVGLFWMWELIEYIDENITRGRHIIPHLRFIAPNFIRHEDGWVEFSMPDCSAWEEVSF